MAGWTRPRAAERALIAALCALVCGSLAPSACAPDAPDDTAATSARPRARGALGF